MSEPQRDPAPVLDYAQPRPLAAAGRRIAGWVRRPLDAFRPPEFRATAFAAAGFFVAWAWGEPRSIVLGLGLLMMLAGAIRYAELRIRSRTAMGFGAKVQLFTATLLCLSGVFAVMFVAAGAGEGPPPDTLTYWRTSNQTYHADSRVALRQAWLTLVGVGWFCGVLAGHYAARLAARARGRNNPRSHRSEEQHV